MVENFEQHAHKTYKIEKDIWSEQHIKQREK